MRHVLRTVVSALTHMHELGILHADLKPANILMRPEDFAATEWVQWLAAVSTTGAASAEAVFCGCISPRGCIFKVALGDLGNAELACPEERRRLKPKPGAKPEDKVVHICTAEYRPPSCSWAMDASARPWTCGPSAAWPRNCFSAARFSVQASAPRVNMISS
jgi:serine/threonine protein kinase